MFFHKCKTCGGKTVAIAADIPVKIGGTLRKAVNVPARQCVSCGDIVVDGMILDRLEQYALRCPSDPLDYGEYEAEEFIVTQMLL